MNNKINILSIDGGGSRGIIPLTILNFLYNNNINIIEKYEYYSGSSVGVLIICMLLSPHINIDIKDINKLKDEFMKLVTKIFNNSYYNMITTLYGYIGPKYNNIYLYNILKEYFGDLTIGDLKGKIIIPLFDILSNEIIIIDTENNSDFKVIDLIMASTAAPTYFKSYEIEYQNKKYIFVDNGVISNTQKTCIIDKLLLKYNIEDINMLCIGTGYFKYNFINNGGLLNWMSNSNITNIFMIADIIREEYSTNILLKNRYKYINVKLDIIYNIIDIIDKKTLYKLVDTTIEYLENNKNNILENL